MFTQILDIQHLPRNHGVGRMCEEYLLAWNDHHASIITAMSELASGIIIISVIYLDYLLLMIDVRCVLVLKNRIMMMMMKITLKIMITIINIIMILILRIIIIIIWDDKNK